MVFNALQAHLNQRRKLRLAHQVTLHADAGVSLSRMLNRALFLSSSRMAFRGRGGSGGGRGGFRGGRGGGGFGRSFEPQGPPDEVIGLRLSC